MLIDEQGQTVAAADVAGSTVVLPEKTYAFHLDAAVEQAVKELLAEAGDGQGAAQLVVHVDEQGQLAVGVLVGHRVSQHLKVMGWGEWRPGVGADAGAAAKISWAP